MPRMRRCGFAICWLAINFWISSVYSDCWYSDEVHEEGTEVSTIEPCLNCTCSRGALLCYLKVCPKLPNPPPPGCILLHRYKTCCPELICADLIAGNELEARAEYDEFDIPYDKTVLENACTTNGSIYGPGSAMDSSSLCEYCYCLGGKQICIKPKCLLPIEGCSPVYDGANCCPARYNCSQGVSSTTTTVKPNGTKSNSDGCLIDGSYYREGGKVLGVGHSACDNCYCLRGIIRCEPLSCAPSLLGCLPIVRPGECCAASYNCSGTIEIQLEPHYGQYPIVSKEYAKFRKEVQQTLSLTGDGSKDVQPEKLNYHFYVSGETHTTKSERTQTHGTTRHFTVDSLNQGTIPTTASSYYKTHNKDVPLLAKSTDSVRNHQQTTSSALYEILSKHSQTSGVTSDEQESSEDATIRYLNSFSRPSQNSLHETLTSADTLMLNGESLLSIVDSLLDSRLNRGVEMKNDSDSESTTEISSTTFDSYSTVTEENFYSTTDTSTIDYDSIDKDVTSTEEDPSTDTPSYSATVKTVINSVDCIDDTQNSTSVPLDYRNNNLDLDDITTMVPVDVNEINKLEHIKKFTTEVTTVSPLKTIELNELTASSNDSSEYDPDSLPPSLPNLRIIPFVAADALYTKKDKNSVQYIPQQTLGAVTPFSYTNLFSPPMETEGGFVPKNPLILEDLYENSATIQSITNSPIANEENCHFEDQVINHGEAAPSASSCDTCVCLYGNIVCEKIPCPIPTPGCRKATIQDASLCCQYYVCDDEESPTSIIDHLDNSSAVHETITMKNTMHTPDTLKDVIKTESALDMQSVKVDILPYLTVNATEAFPSLTTEHVSTADDITKESSPDKDATDFNDFSLDKVWQLLFSGNTEATEPKPETTTAQTTAITTTQKIHHTTESLERPSTNEVSTQSSKTSFTQNFLSQTTSNRKVSNETSKIETSSSGMGLLKLAGCNIYGRMYRVGRIISELSNPCLECKCTETGVQCRDLDC